MKKEITSWKISSFNGIIYGLISFFCFIVCTCLLTGFILRGESFAEHPAKPIVNGVSFQKAYYFYVIVASIIPIILVRYTRVKYVFLNILIYFSVHISMGIIFLLSVLFFNVDIFGLISIAYLIEMGDFCLLAFPEGLFCGTVIAVIINTIRNKCKLKQRHISRT